MIDKIDMIDKIAPWENVGTKVKVWIFVIWNMRDRGLNKNIWKKQ